MKYSVIVFDWDGTLYNSVQTIVECFQKTAEDIGILKPSSDAIKSILGLSDGTGLRSIIPEITSDQIGKFHEKLYKNLYEGTSPVLFNGVKEVLEKLLKYGFELCVATGKARSGFSRDLNNAGISNYFCVTRCGDETFSKPNPQMLFDIMEKLDVGPDKVLMIGDTEHDMLLAKNADVDAVAVTYGADKLDRLINNNPVGVLSDIRELPVFLGL